MFKRTIAALTILAAVLCLAVRVDAADIPRHTKDDTWLIYWYICGPDNLEGGGHLATRDIAEMQNVKFPPNIKVLIAAGSTKQWHHPTIAAGGHGIYLYSDNCLTKQIDWNTDLDNPDTNMGDPSTLAQFLEFGEKIFPADHKILIFQNHGGLNGICYDDSFNGEGLTYDELNSAFSAVYGNSPEEIPFELIGFNACLTGSYELANSLADFSRYMMGSEPSEFPIGWDYQSFFNALTKNPTVNGAQLGKVICDNAMEHYDDPDIKAHKFKLASAFSVIDLTKMPELREAYEAYFDEALSRSNEEVGFSGAFARAAEARTADKFSNPYTDLGLLAKNTKSIMLDASQKLLKAIDKAVVYNKRGADLKSKGISTYYPYISSERPPEESVDATNANFNEGVLSSNSNYIAQKELYQKLLGLEKLPASEDLPIEKINAHFVAKLTPEQLENISSVRCMLVPVEKGETSGYDLDLGGAILTSADDLKVDWKKGIFTENFRAMEPVFDGQKIVTLPSVSGCGHTFYKVPIIYDNDYRRDLLIRYDTSKKKYEIIGFGEDVENGVVRVNTSKPEPGHIITPLHIIISDDPSNEAMGVEVDESTGEVRMEPVIDEETGQPVIDEETGSPQFVQKYAPSIIKMYPDPSTGKMIYSKWTKGTPFVYTRDSAINNKQITRGHYFYVFVFTSPGGYAVISQPGTSNTKKFLPPALAISQGAGNVSR